MKHNWDKLFGTALIVSCVQGANIGISAWY